MPDRKPLFQVVPLSVEVAQPILSLPPRFAKRLAWKAATIVEPKEKVSGSTSVLCWLVLFLYVSLLSCLSWGEGGGVGLGVGDGLGVGVGLKRLTRPILVPTCSVNQRLPSGPAVIP